MVTSEWHDGLFQVEDLGYKDGLPEETGLYTHLEQHSDYAGYVGYHIKLAGLDPGHYRHGRYRSTIGEVHHL